MEQYLLSSAAEKNNLSEKEDVIRKINFTRNMVFRMPILWIFLKRIFLMKKLKQNINV